MIRPGEVYNANFPQRGPRPVIVVSREELNHDDHALIVVCSPAHFAARRSLFNCVPFLAGQFGFPTDCVAQCQNIFNIETALMDLTAGPLGVLDAAAMRQVIQTIGRVIGSDCEPE